MPRFEGWSFLNLAEWPLLVALAVGLLIGAVRERRKGEGPGRASAGLRTFAVVALLGGITAAVGNTGLILVAGSFVAVGALGAYALGDRQDPGLTGEVALVATFALGVLAATKPLLGLEIGIVVAALLAFRVQLHQFVRNRISDQELLDVLTFAIAAIIILPLLPNRPIDPFGLLNPFTLWRLAVIAMGLSGAGYAAQRLVGARYGLLVAGLAAGLVSSTAAVVAMGGRSRVQPALASASAAGAAASLIGSLAYLSAIVAAVSPRLIAMLAAPLGLAALFMLIYAGWLVRGTPKSSAEHAPDGRAFNGVTVLLFVGLVSGFSLASELLIRWLGETGALAGAAVMGLADAHAAAVSMATLLAGRRLGISPAAIGVVLALTTNMAVKVPAAFMSGNRAYAVRVTIGVGLLLTGLGVGCLVMLFSGRATLA